MAVPTARPAPGRPIAVATSHGYHQIDSRAGVELVGADGAATGQFLHPERRREVRRGPSCAYRRRHHHRRPDGALMTQQRTGRIEAEIADESLRTNTGPAGEKPLEMKRAETSHRRHLVKHRRVTLMRLDMGDGVLDPPIVDSVLGRPGPGGSCLGGSSLVIPGLVLHVESPAAMSLSDNVTRQD